MLIAYMALIFTLSAQSRLPQPDISNIDKVEHFIAYAGLSVVAFWSVATARRKKSLLFCFVLAVLIASAYGVTDEFHQRFVPGRSCDPWDWTVDTLGAAAGAAVLSILAKRRRSERDGRKI